MRRAMLLACYTVLATAAPAGADSTPAGDFSFQFSSARPGTPTGLEFRQLYKNPNDPNAKPSPVRRFLFAAPEGSVFDGSAVPACNGTDLQFQLMGKAACPAGSVVGAGFITIMTGVPGEQPFRLDATVFNSGDGIIELFTEPTTGIFLAIERPKFIGANAFEDTEIAPTPGGPPDFQSAAREAYLEFPVSRGPKGRSFITTPPDCSAGTGWTARFEWTNADGNSYGNKDEMPCVPTSSATKTAAVKGNRILVPVRCPKSLTAKCRVRMAGYTKGKRSKRATKTGKVGVKPGKKKLAVMRVKPAARTLVQRKNKMVFRVKIRSGESKLTFFKKIRLVRK